MAKLEKGLKKINSWIKEVGPKKAMNPKNVDSEQRNASRKKCKASAYSAPDDDGTQTRCNYLETAKKLVECIKKMAPLLSSLKR